MQLYRNDFKKMTNENKLTLAIGNFDGVHLGHLTVIRKVVSFKDTKHGILTFDPHPQQVFRSEFRLLSNIDDKIKYLGQQNIDYLFVVNFTNEFASLSKEEFIDFLKKMNVFRLVVGKDFGFGKKKSGNINDLEKHFEVVVMNEVIVNDQRISSSIIKDLIYDANFKLAEAMLGHPYFIKGKVVSGSKIGRKLSFPTANLDYGDYVIPKTGVYYVKVKYQGKVYNGAASIGYNLTLNTQTEIRFEIFLIDENLDLYDKEIVVYFIEYLRPEIKFDSKEALVEQIEMDVSYIKSKVSKGENN